MNSYDEVIQYLESYKDICYNIDFYKNKLEGVKAISYSLEEKGTTIQNSLNIYLEKLDEAKARKEALESFIESNFYGLERIIIWSRYIELKSNKEIANETRISDGYVYKLSKKAIETYVINHKSL